MAGLQFDDEGNLIVGGQSVTAPDAPQPEQGETPVPEAEQPGLMSRIGSGIAYVAEGAADMAYGAVDGIQEGVSETVETIGWAGDELMFQASGAITGTEQNYFPGVGWMTREEVEAANREGKALGPQPLAALDEMTDLAPADTMAGQMTSGVTQFLAGYGFAGKALKGLKATTTAGKAGVAMTKGAVADFAAFDAHEDRFSDFLRDNVGLQDPITEYLSADGDDSVLEGKFKNALEGLGMGLAADGVFRMFKLFKRAKQVQVEQGDEAAAEIMNDGLAEMAEKEPELFGQLELFDEVSDPNLANTGAGKRVVPADGPAPDAPEIDAPTNQGEAAGSVTRANAEAADAIPEPKTPVNTDGLNAALQREIALRRGGSFPDPTRELEGTLFNFDKMDSDVSIKEVMEMATDDITGQITNETGQTFDAWVKDAEGFLAEAVDVSPEIIDASLARMAGDAQRQKGMVIAGKALIQSLSREVEALVYKIDAGTATEMDMDKFVRYEQRLVETSANLKSVITGSAQTTAAGRIRTADWVDGHALNTQDAIGSHLSKDGGIEGIKARARAIKLNKETGGGAQGLMRIVDVDRATPMRVINEVYINSILSGPKTHMVNFMSNAFNTVLLPSEKMIGGAFRGDTAMMREGMRQFTGIRLALLDSFKMMGQAFKSGRNILDPEAAILEANGVDFHAIKYQGENPVLANVINGRMGIGNMIRLPSRLLLTGDELFKQLSYRSSLYSRLSTEAADLVSAGKLTKEQMAKYVSDRMATAFNAKGGARSQVDLDFAREATFTQDLRSGSFFKTVQDITNRHPGLKLIMPFVRTPTNILKAGVQRTPVLRRFSKSLQADLKSGDPRRMAAANGKLVTGSVIWGAGITMAMNGNITGSGPKDPALRARMMETGWRPYSFVVSDGEGGKRYIEYRRFEPFAMFLGIAADVAEIGGQVGEAEMDELATAAVVGLVNNVASKTFMTGLFDVVEAANDPERFLPRLMRTYASNMVPQSAALRELRKQQDPAMREVRSIADAIMNTIPGFSDDLPAKRSWITGEPIMYPKGWGGDMTSALGDAFAAANPIIAGDWKQDPVLDELAGLDFAFSAPTRKVMGVELTTEQYSRLMELHGTVRSGRLTMYQKLERLYESERYRAYPTNVSDASVDPRVKATQRILTGYRELARRKLIQEYPELAEQVRASKAEMRSNIRTGLSGIADLAD